MIVYICTVGIQNIHVHSLKIVKKYHDPHLVFTDNISLFGIIFTTPHLFLFVKDIGFLFFLLLRHYIY